MTETQTLPPVPAFNPLRLWDRVILRRARLVARGQAVRYCGSLGTVVDHLEDGVAVVYADGKGGFLEPHDLVEIPYSAGELA